jgi:hypothetical protein
MPRVEVVDTQRGSGGLVLHCSTQETEMIAGKASAVADIFAPPILDHASYLVIKGIAVMVSWKAKRCLSHGKRLMIVIGGVVPLLFEDDQPY